MTLHYLVRLLCLSFTSFFLLNAVAGLVVLVLSGPLVRFAETRSSIAAARFLLALRLLPVALAAFFVFVLCVPSYLWLEPRAAAERVGIACIVFGFLGAAVWFLSIFRGARAVLSSFRTNRRFARAASEARLSPNSSSVLVLETEAPILALSGLFHARLLVSRSILNALSTEELDTAFSHERSHRISRDNLKRFLILLSPDLFPFVNPLRTLEKNWSKFTEWAADDRAVTGNSSRALSLAAALVRVARLGSAPALPSLSTSLISGDRDLSARVHRLLHPSPVSAAPAWHSHVLVRLACALPAACLGVVLFAPSTFSLVHELQELLLR